jgi:spermidine/putrescine transport system substrate-binding protein
MQGRAILSNALFFLTQNIGSINMNKKQLHHFLLALTTLVFFLITASIGFATNKAFPDYAVPSDCLEQAKKEGTLYIYDWAEWWPEELYTDFEKEFGIKIVRDNYASSDEMLTKFRLNPTIKYDIINVGLIDFIKMKKFGALKKLNHDWIPNINQYLMDEFKNTKNDPGYQYFAPDNVYLTGIAYNSKKVDVNTENLDSWKILFEGNRFDGRITQIDDSYTAIGLTLKYLGYSVNSIDEKELNEAKELLLKQKAKIIAYDANPNRLLVEQESFVSVMWAGDVYWAAADFPEVKLSLPKEGTLMGSGGLVIGKGGPNPAAAHLFLNYLWRPENHVKLIEGIGYTPTHKATPHLLSDEVKSFPSMFPSLEYLSKCEMEDEKAAIGIGQVLRAKIWEEIKR